VKEATDPTVSLDRIIHLEWCRKCNPSPHA